MASHKKSKKEKDVRHEDRKREPESRCCYLVDPCGCYYDPCGCYASCCC